MNIWTAVIYDPLKIRRHIYFNSDSKQTKRRCKNVTKVKEKSTDKLPPA